MQYMAQTKIIMNNKQKLSISSAGKKEAVDLGTLIRQRKGPVWYCGGEVRACSTCQTSV